MDEAPDPESLFPSDLPDDARYLRAVLWSKVNIVLPLRSSREAPEPDYLALKHQLLPRVPTVGENVDLPDSLSIVERVQWAAEADGMILVRLRERVVEPAYLPLLEQAGWKTFTRHDADEWFTREVSR